MLWLYFFFLNDPPPTEIYTLPLHDALPISSATSIMRDLRRPHTKELSTCFRRARHSFSAFAATASPSRSRSRSTTIVRDRKSTRLNSSHLVISYAVFCLKKKNIIYIHNSIT